MSTVDSHWSGVRLADALIFFRDQSDTGREFYAWWLKDKGTAVQSFERALEHFKDAPVLAEFKTFWITYKLEH